MPKKALIIGAGLGGLATALRLTTQGYEVEVVEKHSKPGGRLNQLKKNGFTFDTGPSFFSMSYEFQELFRSCGIKNPLQFNELDPLYTVHFRNREQPIRVFKDLSKLAQEFPEEKNFEQKALKYLKKFKTLFHDTEYRIVKRNYDGLWDYGKALAGVPWKHAPMMVRNMWSELNRHFDTEEVRVVFSLVAFFLGATPFDTPAVYGLLNYTELQYDGYWNVQGGMYQITEQLMKLLRKRGVQFYFNTEIVGYETNGQKALHQFKDRAGNSYSADVYIANADAAAFRGNMFGRKKFREAKLDRMDWTLAPFTIYLGVEGQLDQMQHHNYFLGDNFTEYADKIFKTSVAPQKPYYYVNVSSRSNPGCAPEGHENLFILCPVPDLRYKKDWADQEQLADTIIEDLGQRIGYDLKGNTKVREIWSPEKWQETFNLYKGSGLGLAHGLNQIGGLRPANKDEEFSNLYYVGASTIPGTGLPIVVISSRLATERILEDHGSAV